MQTRRWILKESTSPSKAAGSQSEAHPELYLFDVKPFFNLFPSTFWHALHILLQSNEIKKKKKGWVQAPIIPEIIQFSCYNNFIFLQWSHEQNSHNLNVKVKLVSVSTNVYTCRNHFNANI